MSRRSIMITKVENGFIIEDPENLITVHQSLKEVNAEVSNIFDDADAAKQEVKKEKPKVAPKKEKATKKEEEVEEVSENDLTIDHVREALRDYAADHGKPAAKKVMEKVAKVKKMDDIPENKFADIILACEEAPESDDDEDLE